MSSFTFPLFSQEWDKWELAKRRTSLDERQVEELGRQTKALEKIASATPVTYFQPDVLYRQDQLVHDFSLSSESVEGAIREATEVNLLGQEQIARILNDVRSDLSQLQEELVAGMDQIHDCLVHGFNQLVTTLEVTNYTLQHPLGTQAAEHKERGKQAYEHGLHFRETERARWMSDSESDLRAALELNKYDFEVWYLLGFVLGYERGDLNEGRVAFGSARHYAEPVDAKVASQAARQFGAIATAQQDYEAAVSGYEKAISLDSGNAVAKFELARVLLEGEDPRMTERAYQLLIESVKQEPSFWALAFTDPTFQRSAACMKELVQLQRQLRDKIKQQVSDLRGRFEEARRDLPLNPAFVETFGAELRKAENAIDHGGFVALRKIELLAAKECLAQFLVANLRFICKDLLHWRCPKGLEGTSFDLDYVSRLPSRKNPPISMGLALSLELEIAPARRADDFKRNPDAIAFRVYSILKEVDLHK